MSETNVDDILVLDSGVDIFQGNHGAVCKCYQSSDLIDEVVSEESEFECLVSNIEGALDDGLKAVEDFSLVGALPLSELSGLDRAFLISGNINPEGYWIFVLKVRREAVGQLLRSSTMGYLLGVRIKNTQTSRVTRLIRCSGYDDGETDLLISESVLAPVRNALVLF